MQTAEEIVDTKAAWHLLALLTTAYALAYVDRQLLNLVVDPVKRTLLITDTQFSFIQGAAFILAYVSASPIFGRLVDITNRRNILIFGICAWSICTALCGLAGTYWTLAAARFGVGVSEACVYPVAMSLIPELFSIRRLPRAFSLFALGAQLGGGFSLLAGGAVLGFAGVLVTTIPYLAQLQQWQLAFVIVGLPGLILAIVLLGVREPARRGATGAAGPQRPLPVRESFSRMWHRRSFYGRVFLFGIGNGVVFLSVPSWYPTYLIRVHHMAASEVGLHIGLLTLLFGGGGTLLGPVVAQWLRQRGHDDAPLRAAAAASLGSTAFCLAIPLAPNPLVAQLIFAGIIFCCAFPTSLVAFAVQRPTPGRMRGAVASTYTFISQTAGYGFGPTLIAFTTDHLLRDTQKIGISISIICSIAAALVFISLITNLRPYCDFLRDAGLLNADLAPAAGSGARESAPSVSGETANRPRAALSDSSGDEARSTSH